MPIARQAVNRQGTHTVSYCLVPSVTAALYVFSTRPCMLLHVMIRTTGLHTSHMAKASILVTAQSQKKTIRNLIGPRNSDLSAMKRGEELTPGCISKLARFGFLLI